MNGHGRPHRPRPLLDKRRGCPRYPASIAARPHLPAVLLLLALAAGSGLVAVVGFSLWHGWQQDRARQELDARQAASDLALLLRATLANPATAALLPATARFRCRDGAVEVPAAVGWLVPRPPQVPDPVETGKRLDAERAEFVHGDHELAGRIHDDLLGPLGPTGTAGLLAWSAAGFHAHRRGDAGRAAAILDRLDVALAELPPRELAEARCAGAVAAAALLQAAVAGPSVPLPGWMSCLVPALPPDLAAPTLQRLAERGAEVQALAEALAAIASARASLRQAAAAAALFGERPFARAFAGRLLLWWPDTAGSGHGAWIEPELLRTLLVPGATAGGALQPAAGAASPLVLGQPPAGDAYEVVADLAWVVPRALPERPWFAGPVAITGAAIALLLVGAGSGFFALRALRREAAAVAARAEFLTGVTHELKTPVAAIHLASEVLCEDEVARDKQAEYHELLRGESVRLAALIDNVLDLGQLERGERPHDPQPGDLALLVQEVVQRHRPLLRRAGIELVLREGAACAPAVFDRGGLHQALGNLLENARKYAAAGGRVEVTTALDDRGAAPSFMIGVRDFGPGVPADERETIFARFRRGRAHRHGSIPGLGLGLYLARGIATRHGGSLRCTAPADGSGARFELALPLGDAAP